MLEEIILPIYLITAGPATQIKRFNSDATSALNLIGKIEGWGINPGTKIKNISVNVNEMTGAQLQKLLRALPDGVTYGINLDKEGN